MSCITENILIAGVPLFCLILLLAILLHRSARKRHLLLFDRLFAAAEKEGLHVSFHERIGNRVIGIDERSHKLLFLDEIAKDACIIDLKDISNCRVMKNRSFRTVRTIYLTLFDFQGNLAHELIFFQEFVDSELKMKQFERQSRRWEHLINNYGSADNII